MSSLNESFWNFCLSTWSNQALAQTLINASITDRADVVLVLFCGWVNQPITGVVRLNQLRIHQLSEQYRPMIEQYRAIRRDAKGRVDNQLYNAQKKLELMAERCYADELSRCVEIGIARGSVDISGILTHNEEALLQHLKQVIDSHASKP